MAAAELPVVRFTTPGEMAAAIPHLCGFVPTESIVAVSLRGERHRIGLTIRLDLSAEADAEVGDVIAARLAHDGASSALVVVHTDEPGAQPRALLVRAVIEALSGHGIGIMEALLVRAGCWSSYTCARSCCPVGGTPIVASSSVQALAAAAVYDGRVVLPDRATLVASLAPPVLLTARALEQRLDEASQTWRSEAAVRGIELQRREAVAAVRAALAGPVSDECAARLVVGLQEVQVRDEVAVLALDHAEELLAFLLDLARRSVAPYDVPICTLIAVVSWLRGDGALANVALDRALAADPAYGLARLLRAGLDGQLPPSAVRTWLRETRRAQRPARRRRVA